ACRMGRADELSVTPMDPIEVAQSDRGPAGILGQVLPALKQLHQRRSRTMRVPDVALRVVLARSCAEFVGMPIATHGVMSRRWWYCAEVALGRTAGFWQR